MRLQKYLIIIIFIIIINIIVVNSVAIVDVDVMMLIAVCVIHRALQGQEHRCPKT